MEPQAGHRERPLAPSQAADAAAAASGILVAAAAAASVMRVVAISAIAARLP
jgi:hypothetical protein